MRPPASVRNRGRLAAIWGAVVLVGLGVTSCRWLFDDGDERHDHDHDGKCKTAEPHDSVSGYGPCTEPFCTDLARACDDVLRSGCGQKYIDEAKALLAAGGAGGAGGRGAGGAAGGHAGKGGNAGSHHGDDDDHQGNQDDDHQGNQGDDHDPFSISPWRHGSDFDECDYGHKDGCGGKGGRGGAGGASGGKGGTSGGASGTGGTGGGIPAPGSKLFQTALASCIAEAFVSADHIVEETIEKRQEKKKLTEEEEEEAEEIAKGTVAAEMALCTRRARSCQERVDCVHGSLLPAPLLGDVPGKPPAPLPTTPPRAEPWQDESAAPAIMGPNFGGRRAELFRGDSPSCARCAIEKCPDLAYACFTAAYDLLRNTGPCADVDCCHFLRRCVRDCGGYATGAGFARYASCMNTCREGQDQGAQELSDLQACVRNQCAGCQRFDDQETLRSSR